MKTRNLLIPILIICLISAVGAQGKRFTLDDNNKLIGISSLSISPDGKSAIFMTSKRNMKRNYFERSLVFIDIASRKQTVIGGRLKGISSPTWAPDGINISLIASSGKTRQVYILNPHSEAVKKVTVSPRGIARYSWSPDGKFLAYFTRDQRKKRANIYNNSFEVGSGHYLTNSAPLTTSAWIVDSIGANPKRITPVGFTVATGLTTSALSWSPDGKMIAFTRYPSAFSGDSDLGRNYIYHVGSAKLEPATKNSQRESSPQFSPDNNSLVYRYPRDGFPSNMGDWHQIDLKTKKIRNITKSLDRNTSGIVWLSDGSRLHRAVDKWGNAFFKTKDTKSRKINVGDLVSVSRASMAKSGGLVITGLKKNYPREVYYKKDLDADPVQLTTFNTLVKDIKLGRQEGIEWKSSNGMRPSGILTYPPDFDPKKKYPLVLQIHGGPSGASLLGFSPITQAMAAKGWIVFQPNYRGSTNLGNKFQAAISKDPSEGPGHDVITGVNELKKKAYVDGNRIGVSGWSYGGWMTSWLIGRYPDVWRAAVAGAAPVDLTDMYSLNDLNRMRRHSMVESPYVGKNLEWAFKNSPIFHFSKLKTPTLVMSKTQDRRVTITGSYKLYGALRDNNVPVQFIAYPGPGHFPGDPIRSMDVYQRWIRWLEKHLDNGVARGNDK